MAIHKYAIFDLEICKGSGQQSLLTVDGHGGRAFTVSCEIKEPHISTSHVKSVRDLTLG